jgi:TonB family protein
VALTPETGSGEDLLRSALNKAELEALEQLKLQYFQNATRYLAKGDYDNALSEIKRVLLIDPEHRLAREYEIRVSELQASRAQVAKAEPALSPVKEPPRVAPVTAPEAVRPAPVYRPRKNWLYVSLIALLLLGTAGVLTLDKVDDEEQAPVVKVAAVIPQAPAPAPQVSESTVAEEPTPTIQAPPAEDPKHTSAVAEKSTSKSEPARKEPPAASNAANRPSNGTSAQRTGAAGVGLLAAVTEKKVETPTASAAKEISVPQPEMKLASAQAPPPEPVVPSAPFIATEKEPKLIRLEKVRLSDLAMRTNPSGEVKAKVLVDKEGKPEQVQIVSSTNQLLDQSIIDALQKSTYSPGMMGNDPVSAWMLIPFKFK